MLNNANTQVVTISRERDEAEARLASIQHSMDSQTQQTNAEAAAAAARYAELQDCQEGLRMLDNSSAQVVRVSAQRDQAEAGLAHLEQQVEQLQSQVQQASEQHQEMREVQARICADFQARVQSGLQRTRHLEGQLWDANFAEFHMDCITDNVIAEKHQVQAELQALQEQHATDRQQPAAAPASLPHLCPLADITAEAVQRSYAAALGQHTGDAAVTQPITCSSLSPAAVAQTAAFVQPLRNYAAVVMQPSHPAAMGTSSSSCSSQLHRSPPRSAGHPARPAAGQWAACRAEEPCRAAEAQKAKDLQDARQWQAAACADVPWGFTMVVPARFRAALDLDDPWA